MKKMVVLLLILAVKINLYPQNCDYFHKDIACHIENTKGFKLFGQSRSAIVETGIKNEFQVAVYGGYDYKVSVCTLRGFGPIHLRIINPEDQSVLYDNESDKYIETFGFSNEKTKNLTFEITLIPSKKKPRDVWDTRACLGISMYWHKMRKLSLYNN